MFTFVFLPSPPTQEIFDVTFLTFKKRYNNVVSTMRAGWEGKKKFLNVLVNVLSRET